MTLAYQEYGDRDAPLLLFLHGGGVSSWMWDRQVQHFTDYHCVTVDLPEHGKSTGNEQFTIKDSSLQVIKLIEKVASGKVITVVGFSLGAQVLIQMVSTKPDLVDYAFINSALVRPTRIGRVFINPLVNMSYPLIKNRTFSKLQAKTLYLGKEHFEKYYTESCQMKRHTLVRILQENMSFEIPNGFSEASGSIVVTVGEKEKGIMKNSALDLVKANPNCTGVIIPGIGHGVSLAEPDLFNRLIKKWMDEKELPKECMAMPTYSM
ncbi:alpha/beta fold hydrolase [Sporosarcina sp. CAU 1771]